MSGSLLFVTQLKALHSQCLGLAHTIETVLISIEQSPDAESLPACEHPIPFRQPMAAMGHPTRFRCQSCGEEVDA